MKRVHILYKEQESFITEFNRLLSQREVPYLLVLSERDTVPRGFAEKLRRGLDQDPALSFVTPKTFFQCPDRLTGVMLRKDRVKGRLRAENGSLREAALLLPLLIEGSGQRLREKGYSQGDPGSGNYAENQDCFNRDWYFRDLQEVLLPFLQKAERVYGRIPAILQRYALFTLRSRLDANQNNRNRHALSPEETDELMELYARILEKIDDEEILNSHKKPVYSRSVSIRRMLLRIKYRTDYVPLEYRSSAVGGSGEEEETPDFTGYFRLKGGRLFPVCSLHQVKPNILLMDLVNGCLEVDGTLPDFFREEAGSYHFLTASGKRIALQWNEGYSLTKYFGRSAYKRFSFHASIPLSEEGEEIRLVFTPKGGEEDLLIPITYPSHTSRLAAYPHHSYWHAKDRGEGKSEYLLQNIYKDGKEPVQGIRALPFRFGKEIREEAGLLWELLSSRSMHRFRFFLLRAAWIATRPYYRNKRIWFYMDKIYKAGDSSEYLYRYGVDQKDGIRHRYLLDPQAPDAARLKKSGYQILPRGSFRHRLDFLNAEKVFATNSTIFAFNDYYLENSRYIRGIPDFDVVCLQHGLSVQKIAAAQNRLRDNTRLYCCASPVEMENLSRPVYNYPDPAVLQLTGIPRYDGLKSEPENMILISPTWRMQSAMPVTRNEGVERDYNPYFRKTPYFQIYSSLLSDERLLRAAREKNCRIIYLMHPITSPQARDFSVEPPVEIVPATADMSYEEYLRKGALMVTDYSGVQFDFAWMKKPLIYFQPPELEGHYEEGTFHYDTMAFGEITREKEELVEALIRYMDRGFLMPEEYRKRVERFFRWHDHENTRRVYEKALKMGK